MIVHKKSEKYFLALFLKMDGEIMNKKIKGYALLATLMLTSTPLDLFSRGGGHGGGGHGGGNHNGNHHGYHHGGGWGGGAWGGFAVGMLATGVLLSSVNSSNYNSTLHDINNKIDDLRSQQDDLSDENKELLRQLREDRRTLQEYKENGFTSTEAPQATAPSTKRKSMKAELIDEAQKVEAEVKHLEAYIEADI